MTNGCALKCFLSYGAAKQAEADAVVTVLQELNVDTFAAHDILPGQAIAPTILGALRAADFICLVLAEEPPSANVAFEAGLAIGLGKPVLALSRQPSIPFDVGHGIQVVRLKSRDISPALSDIRRFVRHIKPKIETSPKPPFPDRAAVEKARAELKSARLSSSANQRGRAVVDVVAQLFDQPGIELLQEEITTGGGRPDFLLWSDPLVSELGGPLIVECKYYGGGSGSVLANARKALQQLATYVELSSAGLGLLVFDHDRPTNLKLSGYETPKALAFYVGDLIDTVGAGKLTDELWRRRARAARLRSLAVTPVDLRPALDAIAAEVNPERKGRLLEEMIAELFSSVPGLALDGEDVVNAFQSEEIDLIFWNEQHDLGFRFLDCPLIVECKGWSRPSPAAKCGISPLS